MENGRFEKNVQMFFFLNRHQRRKKT